MFTPVFFILLHFFDPYVFSEQKLSRCSEPNITITRESPIYELYPLANNTSNYYNNMQCSWKINVDLDDYIFVLKFDYYFANISSGDNISITNCRGKILVDLDSPIGGYTSLPKTDYIQEDEICVTFNSTTHNSNHMVYQGEWNINFTLQNGPSIYTKKTFPSGEIITVDENLSWDHSTACTFTSYENGPFNSSSKSFTIWCPVCSGNYTFITQNVYRIYERHTANCNSNNLFYLDPIIYLHEGAKINIGANSNGDCMYTILAPNAIRYNFQDETTTLSYPYLDFVNFTYEGNSSVQLINELNHTLIQFNENDAGMWNHALLANQLISLIIPKNGNLIINFGLSFLINYFTSEFENDFKSAFSYPMYPSLAPINLDFFPASYAILSKRGVSRCNVTIIHAVIPKGVSLVYFNGNGVVKNFSNNDNPYELISTQFDSTLMAIEILINVDIINNYTILPNMTFLLQFEGKYIDHDPQFHYWWIALAVGVCVIIMVIIIIAGMCYYKKKKKRFEQLYDILAEMNMSLEEIEKLKRKSDQFLIEAGKIHINFEAILGQGAFSTVYKGRLIGPSPLHLIARSIETQKFCDCDVAVKVATRFGQNEGEQLFKEIAAMKTIGYHENVMCMLGWTMPEDKPCLVFDIAKMDLLKFVKEFRGKSLDELPMKIFISVLWQVAKGMQYISSQNMVHRDLAARNVLLLDSYTAKISDFGLCCTMNETFAYQAAGRTKKLPIKWLSIEALVDRTFSEKSDVWSYGVLMYEVFSLGKVPYATMNNDEVLEFLLDDKRLECPENAPDEIDEIMKKCWKRDAMERPKFENLVDRLYELLEVLSDEYACVY